MFAHAALLRSVVVSVARNRQPFARNIAIGARPGGLLREQQARTVQGIRGGLFRQLPALQRGYAQLPGDNGSEGKKVPEGVRDSSAPEYGTPEGTTSASSAADPILPTDANATPITQQESAEARENPDTISESPSEAAPDGVSSAQHQPPPPPPFSEDPYSRILPGHGKGADGLPKSAYISSADRKRERLARVSFIVFFLTLVTSGFYLSRDWDTEEDLKKHAEDAPNGYSPGLMYKRVRARLRDITTYYEEPVFEKLLPDPLPAEYQAPYTLVLGLEDLLIHTEWDKNHGWRSAKRPGLDYFLGYLSMYYELVVFSDSPSHLIHPIAEKMGQYPGFVTMFLSREATRYKDGKYIKVYHTYKTYICPKWDSVDY